MYGLPSKYHSALHPPQKLFIQTASGASRQIFCAHGRYVQNACGWLGGQPNEKG